MDTTEETVITEISISPQGRVYVFGLSREVLELLAAVCPADGQIVDRIERLTCAERACEQSGASNVTLADPQENRR